MKLKAWWKAWSELIWKLVALLGSQASLVGLLMFFLPSPKDLPWWAIGLLIFAALSSIGLVVLEIISQRSRRVFDKGDNEGIKQYMHSWIAHGGRVAIWTRDMSWANNSGTRGLLKKKAERGELILCLPEQNALTKELEAAGAEVCAYGTQQLESPSSRFTIVFFGRDGSRVAVGRADSDTHIIDEFAASDNPAFYLAEDLIKLVRALHANSVS